MVRGQARFCLLKADNYWAKERYKNLAKAADRRLRDANRQISLNGDRRHLIAPKFAELYGEAILPPESRNLDISKQPEETPVDTEENHAGLKGEIDEHTEGTLSDARKIDNCEEKAIDYRDAENIIWTAMKARMRTKRKPKLRMILTISGE